MGNAVLFDSVFTSSALTYIIHWGPLFSVPLAESIQMATSRADSRDLANSRRFSPGPVPQKADTLTQPWMKTADSAHFADNI